MYLREADDIGLKFQMVNRKEGSLPRIELFQPVISSESVTRRCCNLGRVYSRNVAIAVHTGIMPMSVHTTTGDAVSADGTFNAKREFHVLEPK